ncbi:hypothetical protein MASR2M79_20790 [Aminivibrio sp.]
MTEGGLSRNVPEMFKEPLGHRHGTMPPPRTADPYMEVGLSGGEIERNYGFEREQPPQSLRPLIATPTVLPRLRSGM